jgi:dihydroflavonol-4-reductase
MQVLVTGATGKVGHAVMRASRARGDDVRVLVRDPVRARAALGDGVEMVTGDVTDRASVQRAVAGCEVVYNAMGLPEQWFRDPAIFDQVNAEGTRTVVECARSAGVRRVVHTSTIDVFHADAGASFDESAVADYPKGTAYERSKQRAETLALAAAGDMELVIVNPSAVYGPGPAGSASLERSLFAPLVRRRLPALPPGGLGLVFTEGLGQGHLLAAEKGRPGERYILCDEHATFRELAEAVIRVAGRGRIPPALPVPVARGFAAVGEAIAHVIRRPPMLARGQLLFTLWNAAPDSSKAQRELGWHPTPLDEGIRRTLQGMGLV